MTDLTELIRQGSTHLWLFIPSAILLGALHGLEPGHSKTMMAAFIIAIRGTIAQAVLLGLSATLSHTAVVWAVALTGMYYFGGHFNAESTEPYFQAASGVLIIGIAVWMLVRTWREQHRDEVETDHHHHHHGHDETHHIDTGHGIVELSIFEDGIPPHFRLRLGKPGNYLPVPPGDHYTVETERPDGKRQTFRFAPHEDCLQSMDDIPEPHNFTARLKISHGDHEHAYDVVYAEHDHDHDHDHEHGEIDLNVTGFQDAHELAHANDIRRRFESRSVTTGQIIVFGLTGGLIPCPAAITVLLLCLQLKHLPLGALLVLCFSIGLALTMVTTGVIAAMSVRYAGKKFSGFGDIVRRAPYVASLIIVCMGVYITLQGLSGIPTH
jgi:nickel/cobalt exporter